MGIQTPNVSHGEPVFITLCYLQVYKLLKGESINHINLSTAGLSAPQPGRNSFIVYFPSSVGHSHFDFTGHQTYGMSFFYNF